ncbi:fungal-specific transcription factor domain-containing protein [Spinellus fusiger]|nr:fungal-specific transcription factor domain-containing protein [Spinellus fusiger]
MRSFPFVAQKINFKEPLPDKSKKKQTRNNYQDMVFYAHDEEIDVVKSEQILRDAGVIKISETIKGTNDWIFKVSGLDRQMSDCLMKIYFAYIHPGLPVVNKQLFLQQYRGQTHGYPYPPLLNSIFGAAIRYIETCKLFGDKTPPEYGEDRNIPEGSSESVFENLIIYFKGKYQPSLSTIQALVIVHNHYSSLDEKVRGGWLLSSTAQDLGLHRSSDNWDISEWEKETRKRVWWAVYVMDKWNSAGTGRPQTDCDQAYPNDSASWEEVMDIADKNESETDSNTRFPSLEENVAHKVKREKIPIYQPFVQLVKLSEILGKVLQGLYTPKAKKHSALHGSDTVVTYLDTLLSEWRSSLPPALQISSINVHRLDSHGKTPLLSMSGLIYLAYCTLLMLLHRPFIEQDTEKNTKSSLSSLSICTNAATRCVDIAEKMHYRDFLLISWNFSIYPVFTASVIHVYNASNTDSIISDVAISNVIKAIIVIKRLSKITPSAEHMYHVLRRLMHYHKIPCDDNDFVDEGCCKINMDDTEIQRTGIKRVPSIKKRSEKKRQHTPAKKDHISDISTENQQAGILPVMSDVGRGNHVKDDQLNYNILDTDPYILRQFGLTQEQLFEQSSNQHMRLYQPMQISDTIDYNDILSMKQFQLFQASSPTNNLENTYFRNRPDNPFWSVPSSIKLDDWAAYLLPEDIQQFSESL